MNLRICASTAALALLCLPLGGCGDTEDEISTQRAPLTAVCIDEDGDAPDDGWRCDEHRVVECDTHAGGQVEYIYVLDDDGPLCDETELDVSDAGPYAPGEHTIEVVRVEGDDAVLVCEATLEVVDTTPPAVEPQTVELWPPNHRLELIEPWDCLQIEDACDPDVEAVFTWATSDEPADAEGDGNTDPDIVGLACDGVQLRAERAGGGDGRVYTLGWLVRDDAGNTAEGECRVIVPHDRGRGEAIDSGEAERVELDADACPPDDDEKYPDGVPGQ